MKTEEQGWRALRAHAAAQLPANFADQVLRVVEGPTAATWQQFQAQAAAQIRPGFAERVLRAAREFPSNMPSLFGQLALGAATVAVCLAAVVAVHSHSARLDEQVAIASWQQLAMDTQDVDHGL